MQGQSRRRKGNLVKLNKYFETDFFFCLFLKVLLLEFIYNSISAQGQVLHVQSVDDNIGNDKLDITIGNISMDYLDIGYIGNSEISAISVLAKYPLKFLDIA